MSVSHVGGPRPLAVVPQQQSGPTPNSGGTELDRNLLPDVRKTLPPQAKGAANGLSVDKFFDKLDTNGDGTITQAEAGHRWGHGVLGELLKLQEDAGQNATAGGTTDGSGTPASDTPPPPDGGTDTAGGTTASGGTDPAGGTTDPGAAGGTDQAGGGAGSDTTTASAGGSDTTAGTDLASTLTPPPPSGDAVPDPTQILDGTAA